MHTLGRDSRPTHLCYYSPTSNKAIRIFATMSPRTCSGVGLHICVFSQKFKSIQQQCLLRPYKFFICDIPYDPSAVVTDSMTDSRDGQTYRTVTIGTQTWMAQNLNYKSVNSYCYNDSSKYCDQYGRLYTWAAAMDSAGSRDVNGKGCGFESACSPKHPVRGVCPEGWHLPDSTEWMTFINSVGSVGFAGIFIKDGNWYMQGRDKNSYYFTALPSGNRTCEERSINEGTNAFIWSSTEKDSKIAYNLSLFYRSDRADLSSSYKCIGISVRCLKD